ncbi:hypothetical protein EVAR_67350_1 [Eumeta japonica]|uniref:Uncharacterized protein n=1 Tax=Eumeta variegata TaxID=151549 RepID=A0A4C1TPR5_EUMVA|nr:hypothetical protein EVAR_67350_1 [Eumeta japonica]
MHVTRKSARSAITWEQRSAGIHTLGAAAATTTNSDGRTEAELIKEQILSCKQDTRETASSFGDRIEVLLHEALDTITIQWEDESSQKVMTDDFKRVAVKTFIKGLRDRALRARFIDQQKKS